MKLNITWYGRCCFLAELDNKKILFDPYDRYCNVDIGLIDADLLLSSSTWHDHGHIGASPQAWIYTYPGIETNFGFQITGIEAKEDRGTPTVIFNIQNKDISITNFADFGPEREEEFNKNLTSQQRDILQSTNIAFIRPSITTEEITVKNIHNENALKYCSPNIIIPEHYFPRDFILRKVPESVRSDFLRPNIIVDEMTELFTYPVKEIDDFIFSEDTHKIKNMKTIVRFLKVHDQVKYID
ncbi:hypothetical protein COX08_04660 [Candidatus Beckwithbacteria bacterium CG23_combo_of_CG06-09_8_20_14_all_34_8]|uniref:MBL fold metallo-hydrolase n=1 Tax=Candidatus Beckwithbacteria bacterium CG23_combo_of_CG06-09_8_20_14_all_34_8 TaxID=1974497 RepID=A0A2H0B532_9BACT|nr:MAG: hypothetical protein COX08_04660 [Candidatus Beckwithbacteria bacterium CG23_combo_of_CG06-09_8_20_14_all_34_8]